MPHLPDSLHTQIHLIQKAMREAGVWSHEIPEWVIQYDQETFPDVWQWLQFIYLPMRLQHEVYKPHYLAPVVSPYIQSEPQKIYILQLVIELDSITTTFHTT